MGKTNKKTNGLQQVVTCPFAGTLPRWSKPVQGCGVGAFAYRWYC